jgi:hypothetical protein
MFTLEDMMVVDTPVSKKRGLSDGDADDDVEVHPVLKRMRGSN